MASFSRQFATDSPVLAIAPHPPHQPMSTVSSLSSRHEHSTAINSVHAPSPCAASVQSTATISRKRSRDEASVNLEPDAPPSPVRDEPEGDWIYGEGMVLIKPDAGYIADASSQSGTWLEEKNALDEEARRRQQTEEQPQLRSHKSQRMDHDSDDAPSSVTLAGDAHALLGGTPAAAAAVGPVVDDFTLHLGIGWRRISDDEDIQAAARGWARFIENHYPLRNVQVALESKGLQSYLVESSEGYYLFAEDLRQARFVSRNVEGTLQNLQCSPPRFDSDDTLTVTETPRPSEMPPADTEMYID